MNVKVLHSQFLYSVPKLSIMKELGGEIAFIGRSNSGKSSLINSVCHKKDLARTSKLPGRTRHAVVYEVIMAHHEEQKNITLVDLPGFGFASMSKTEAEECEQLIFSYLTSRIPLKQIFLLLDIRRDPDQREQQILEIARKRQIGCTLVLTKCDKVSVSARKPIIKKLSERFGSDSTHIELHSTHDESYKHILQERIFSLM